MFEVNLIALRSDGHRIANDNIFSKLLAQHAVSLSPNNKKARVDFFTTLDDNNLFFFYRALCNALTGRRTVGLFFRPRECFRKDKKKYLVKRIMFSLAKYIPRNYIITIVPFYVDQKFCRVANGWIHDPQLWDLDLLDRDPSKEITDLTRLVREQTAGRRIITELGLLNIDKGFDFFAKIWRDSPLIREEYLFVAAGKVAAESTSAAVEFSDLGGLLIDRFISDDELLLLYQISDVIWTCYSPSYDQASGVFGRAFQFGKPAIVRCNSNVSVLAEKLNHPILSIPFDDVEVAADHLINWLPPSIDRASLATKIKAMRSNDVDTLLTAFGVGVHPVP